MPATSAASIPRVTENHLRYLEKWGLVRPRRTTAATERDYSFTDLTTIKHVAAELERGTPLRVILRALLAERQGQLRSISMRRRRHARAKVVALPGDADAARRDKPGAAAGGAVDARQGPAFPFSDPQAALAAKYFIEARGSTTATSGRWRQAAAAYRKALVIDPDLVPAIVNLANIHYARDEMIEAQALYERAISLEPHCFEAHFNLGNIHHDLGRFDDALVCYRDAVRAQPRLPRRALLPGGDAREDRASPEAKPHWKAYQDLAPDGEWLEFQRVRNVRKPASEESDAGVGYGVLESGRAAGVESVVE